MPVRLRFFLPVLLFAARGFAHTVPTLVLESEFTGARACSMSVNVDPRLFLSEQPTSLPPVPASWFFEQDAANREKTGQQTRQYLAKSLRIHVGETELTPEWKITPIDSASSAPLAPESAEVHLLAEWTGHLPAKAGDFKVALEKGCAVSLIVLNGTEGKKERRPQVIFPGETSRGYPLPDIVEMTASPGAKVEVPSGAKPISLPTDRGHLPWDHVAMVVVLAMTLSRRPVTALMMLVAFHLAQALGVAGVVSGWLLQASGWVIGGYWVALVVAAVGLLMPARRVSLAFVSLAAAGVCHGLNVPHLHLSESVATPVTSALAWSAAMFLRQATVLLLGLGLLALVRRLLASDKDASHGMAA